MKFELNKSIEILERTPRVIASLLSGISQDWLSNNEGKDTFSPYDVVGHLIHNELTDWMPRLKIICSEKEDKTFEPFDRFAHFKNDQTIAIEILLETFKKLRKQNLDDLHNFNLNKTTYLKTGIHPALGTVNLKELISAWVVHDLGHIGQIVRVMAKQYKDEVGPWIEYLGVLHK